jgi:hypothetical protein
MNEFFGWDVQIEQQKCHRHAKDAVAQGGEPLDAGARDTVIGSFHSSILSFCNGTRNFYPYTKTQGYPCHGPKANTTFKQSIRLSISGMAGPADFKAI